MASQEASTSGTTGNEAAKKGRSSRACDPCRRAKSRCTREPNEAGAEEGPCTNCRNAGIECTFLGASKKRGPPKGYIEAIENRMHRMEALLGGLLHNDDPRAQALLEELVGDIEARELLSRDLQSAVATGRNNTPALKSWQRFPKVEEAEPSLLAQKSASSQSATSKGKNPISQRGFDTGNLSLNGTPGTAADSAFSPFSAVLAQFNASQDTAGNDSSWLANEDLLDTTVTGNVASTSEAPRHQRRRLDNISSSAGESSYGPGSVRTGNSVFSSQMRAQSGPRDGSAVAVPASIGHTGSAYYHIDRPAGGTSLPTGANTQLSISPGSSHRSPHPVPEVIDLSSPGAQTPASADATTTSGQAEGPLSELADVVGQLSLDENKEVRYHGRSSGLYLISKSARYKDFFWRFPKAGVWPPAEPGSEDEQTQQQMITEASPGSAGSPEHATSPSRDRESAAQGEGVAPYPYGKTEEEIIAKTRAKEALPDKRTSDHLLELYWIFVHPHIPLLYRSLFVRQYRNTIHGSASTGADGRLLPAQAVGGRVPAVLLFALYSVAARYSDTGSMRKEGVYWKAGDGYATKAKELIHEDFGSSRLTTVQALLLLSYREVGCGAMAQSWIYLGMATRMAQDLGLFRDVDKWFLPVNAFGYEEKQTRKRVWWACIVMDKYVSAYIGRPMAIFERDYDVALPAEDEPDEHDIWRPIRPDGTDWSEQPVMNTTADPLFSQVRSYPQGVKSNSISCFNHSATLSVLFSRIISNLYAIRVRVLGQHSESLLAHLDQALANWYISLPPHLQYNSASKRAPPPHVLALHCQFFAALILLHRPFIPANRSAATQSAFPSHSICTTAAAAITNIVTLYSRTYTLRQCIPFLTYYIFSAGIMHVYNSTYDEAMAPVAKSHLVKCMRALKEMENTWASASRQNELLQGIVDLRDVDVDAADAALDVIDVDDIRGRKRQADTQNPSSRDASHGRNEAVGGLAEPFKSLPTFHTRPAFANAQGQKGVGGGQPPRRIASGSAASNRKRNSSSAVTAARNASSDRPRKVPSSVPSAVVSLPAVNMPSADFTFVSPTASAFSIPVSGDASQISVPSLGSFDFGAAAANPNVSPGGFNSINITSPIGIAPNLGNIQQHSYNILGLSSAMDFAPGPETSAAAQMSASSSALPSAADANAINWSASTFGNSDAGLPTGMSDFMFDPFWQAIAQGQFGGLDTTGAQQVTQTNSTDPYAFQSGFTPDAPGFTSPPADLTGQAAFLGVPFSADPSADEWTNYLLQAMPPQDENR